MDQQPIRYVSSRRPVSVRSHQTNSSRIPDQQNINKPFMDKKKPVSKEEVRFLKERKNELIEETKVLKTKIARLQVQTRRGSRPPTTNSCFIDQLTKEYNSLESLIQKQRNKLREMKMSDDANLFGELREESLVVYNERLRLQDVQLQSQKELEDSQQELQNLIQSDGPETLSKQREKIIKYEEIAKKYKKVNKKLTKKVKLMRAERARNEDTNEAQVEYRIKEIKGQIVTTKNATKKYEEKLEKSKIEHEKIMMDLRKKLGFNTKEETKDL